MASIFTLAFYQFALIDYNIHVFFMGNSFSLIYFRWRHMLLELPEYKNLKNVNIPYSHTYLQPYY